MTIIGQDNSFVKACLIMVAIGVFCLLGSLISHLFYKKSYDIYSMWCFARLALFIVGTAFTITFLLVLSVGIRDKVQIVKVSDKAYMKEILHDEYGAKIIEIKNDYIVVSIPESEIKKVELQVKLEQLLDK